MIRLAQDNSFGRLLMRFAQKARGPRRFGAPRDEDTLLAFPAMYVDISVTVASVLKGSGASTAAGIAGATITAGQPLYQDSTASNQLKPCSANTSQATAACVGIALHGALAGQPITYLTAGPMTFNAVLTVGKAYVVSANAGGIAPIADLATGWYTTFLGLATTSTSLTVSILVSGAVN